MTERNFEGDDATIPAIQQVIETLGVTTVQATLGESSPDRPEHDSMESLRPEWLKLAIDSEFSNIIRATKDYGYHGTKGDYSFGSKSATERIADYRRERRNGGPLRILDVGTGAGAFLTMNNWPTGDIVHGISAFDYRTNPMIGWPDVVPRCLPSKDDPRYLVGNAEYLSEVEGVLPQYDVIVSKRALQHLVDPLGSLEAIANRVAPGGMLCLHAGRTNHKRATSLLLRHGFRFLDEPSAGIEDIPENFHDGVVLIRAEDQPVRFGLGYEHKGREFERELEQSEWPLTPHEVNTLSWRYVEPGRPRFSPGFLI